MVVRFLVELDMFVVVMFVVELDMLFVGKVCGGSRYVCGRAKLLGK